MIPPQVLNFLRGDLTRKTMLFVIAPLIFASYFGILGIAVLLYPDPYDWRYMSVSKLLYPRNNPEFHYIATVSIALSSVLMLPFAGYIRRRLRRAAPRTATVAAVLLFLGCICLTFAGLITSHPALGKSPLPKLHENLARISMIGIAAGMLLFNAAATKAWLQKKPGQPLPPRRLLISWNLLTLPVLPITVTWLLIRIYLKHSAPTHHAIVHSLAWNLGFWEWIGSALIFLFLLCAALFLPQDSF